MHTRFTLILLAVLTIPPQAEMQSDQSKGDVKPLATTGIFTATYCELISNPDAYNAKVVRLRATYLGGPGGEGAYFYFPDRTKEELTAASVIASTIMAAEFEKDFDSSTKPDVKKAFLASVNADLAIEVSVVGKFYGSHKFGHYGHLGGSAYKFVVTQIEYVAPVKQK